MKMPAYNTSWLEHISALFFPEQCICCHAEGALLCPGCLGKINPLTKPSRIKPEGIQTITKLYTPCHYHKNPVLQKALHYFKYRYFKKIGYYLAPLLYNALSKEELPHTTHIVPIPLHKRRKTFRGFNQSLVLATHLSSYFNFPVTPILKRVKKTISQATLSREQRIENLINAFDLCHENLPPTHNPSFAC